MTKSAEVRALHVQRPDVRTNWLVCIVALAAALAALSSCSSAGRADSETSGAIRAASVVPTTPALIPSLSSTPVSEPSVGAPQVLPPVPGPTSTPTDEEALTERIDYSLAVAAYGPFNQDGQDGIGPYFFGSDEDTQQAGFACYQQRLGELVDFAALRLEAATINGSYFNVPPEEALNARRAAAHCISAENYRLNWINAHVWGWNTYGRDRSTPELKPTDPCFAPVYRTPEEFVDAVVAGTLQRGRLDDGFIGPFPCADPVG